MAKANPYLSNGRTDKGIFDTWGVRIDADDNMRVIWFADGKLHHGHSKWKNIHTVHNDIWSWRNWEPDVVWCFHMGLKGWCRSFRSESGDTTITAMERRDDGSADVPKDIELYNALLGE